MKQYNIYFGTIGSTLGVCYRYTTTCKSDEDANKHSKNAAASFYYKNEGKHGIPSYSQIATESKITGLSIEKLSFEHIDDIMRWHAIPTDLDTISIKKLKFN